MPTEGTCAECGAPLPANAPGNRCPKCLLQLALGDSGHDPAFAKTSLIPQSEMLTEQVGMMIGRYKLLQEIGEGGFGVVFMAEQQEPVQRKVALKIIKAGMDTREIIARFEAERQALALMDHPNIAQVLDGGTTAAGRPYFVMELVRGIPITDYCDQTNLSTRERLELFIKVCRAIQHAHQKGIIHRDLKPSNVLVTLHDGEPVPKVIDFGVAKALGQKLTDKTLFTRFEQMIGTPAYMSPEQAALSGLDIDTRSDIYSLGVLLYQLLTGVTPLDAQTLRQCALDEIRRMIQETDPPKPSTRLTELAAADVRRLRSKSGIENPTWEMDRASLRRLLQQKKELISAVRGDLDWITMKALEKDRHRRYETVNGFAADVERHLRDEPVAARPPSALYRIQKVAHRHRLAFAAGTAIAVALILGVFISTWQAVRATRAERQARNAQSNEATQRQRAEQNATESRTRLVRQYVANGNRLVERGEFFSALPWFAKALREEQEDEARAKIHRLRLASTIQQCPKLVHIWFHEGRVNDVQFSPDGSRVATASGNTARVWDAVSGDPLTPPLVHPKEVGHVRFSSDGRSVATACDRFTFTALNHWDNGPNEEHIARVWDAATGEPRTPPLRHAASVRDIGFSPDGRWIVTASDDHTAQIWDAATGEPRGSPVRHSHHVHTAQFSPDGGRLLTASTDGTARVWDVATGDALTPPLSHGGSVNHAVFSPAGLRVLTGADDDTARVWDATTGKQIALRRHGWAVWHVAFSPDGRIAATTSSDGTAQLWNASSGELSAPPLQHKDGVFSVGFSQDGRWVVTASQDRTARVWDATSGQPVTPALPHAAVVGSAALSPDGYHVITGAADNTARLWDISGSEPSVRSLKHSDLVHKIAFHPKSDRAITISRDDTAFYWDLSSGNPAKAALTNLALLRHAAFSHDGKLLALAHNNGTAEVWDLEMKQLACPRLQHQGPVNHIEFSPEGQRVVTASADATASVWDLSSGRLIARMLHAGAVGYASFSQDGTRIATATLNATEILVAGRMGLAPDLRVGTTTASAQARLWSAMTGEPICSAFAFPGQVSHMDFSPDRRYVTATDGGPARIVDLVLGKRIAPKLEHNAGINFASMSQDGKRVATASSDDTARVWDSSTGRPVTPTMSHQHFVHHASFSPDGLLVATASKDQTVRIWDATTGEAVTPPLKKQHSGSMNRAFFSPDGSRLAVSSGDGFVHVWALPQDARPVEHLLLLAELLASQQVDEIGGLMPLKWEDLRRAWDDLRARYPADFVTSAEQRLAWHQRKQAEQADSLVKEHYHAGRVHLQLSQWSEAVAEFTKAIPLKPEDATMLNDIAWYYVTTYGFPSPEKALPLALKAVELGKAHHNELNTLGVVYYRLGEFEKARATLETSVRTDVTGGTAHDFFFLAMSYQRLGDSRRAAENFAKGEKWLESQSDLYASSRVELEHFRAEAEGLLRKANSD